ncbi:MAG: outer membrane protein [Caulobacteraceae bacterium]
MKTLILTAAALAVSAVAVPAFAQGNEWTNPQTYLNGTYVEATGGSTFQGATTQFNSSAGGVSPGSNQGSGHFRDGWFGSALVGHKLAPGLSVELEGVYIANNYNGATEAAQGVGGDSRTYGGFGNVRFSIPYDYKVGRFALVPYVAGGIGYGDVRTRLNGADGYLNTDESGFMWQGKAGIEIKTGTPVSFDLGYRYIEAPEADGSASTVASSSSFTQKTHMQAATFGVKYSF